MKAALIIVYMSATIAISQEYRQSEERVDIPQFSFDALVFAGEDTATSRLDVYTQVPYQALRFVRGADDYDAAFEEIITIYDENNNLVVEKLSTERILGEAFAATADPSRYQLTQRFFRLAPGRYTIAVQVQDEETRKSARATREINVRDLRSQAIALSDIMLVSHLRLEENRRTIVPNVSGNVGNLPEGFYLFCEIYNRTGCDTMEVTYHVKTSKNEEPLKETFFHPATPGKNQLFVKINSAHLPMGTYTVGLQVAACSQDIEKQKVTSMVSHSFVIRWTGIPLSIDDLDLAVEQLIYAAEADEIAGIKSASAGEAKRQRFYEFWKKRDPTPNSERNEAMEEYYGRVAYANKNFSNYREGWKTDRGMVYIILGPPSTVDRHPFEGYSKPFETWFYNDLNYKFLFVDQTGFGDYRLDPSTPLWNIKNRRR